MIVERVSALYNAITFSMPCRATEEIRKFIALRNTSSCFEKSISA
jgi:hypothetical protein